MCRVFDREMPILQMDHFFPLSGALFEFPMRAIGHLESINEDWDALIRPLYNIDAEVTTLSTHAHLIKHSFIHVHTY